MLLLCTTIQQILGLGRTEEQGSFLPLSQTEQLRSTVGFCLFIWVFLKAYMRSFSIPWREQQETLPLFIFVSVRVTKGFQYFSVEWKGWWWIRGNCVAAGRAMAETKVRTVMNTRWKQEFMVEGYACYGVMCVGFDAEHSWVFTLAFRLLLCLTINRRLLCNRCRFVFTCITLTNWMIW